MESPIIGYIDYLGYFLCPTCTGYCSSHISNFTPVYDVNVAPYSQDCAMCKKVTVQGQVDTILFNNAAVSKRIQDGKGW
jgi:hypothetical protein